MKGLLIRESLADAHVLDVVRTTRTESWQVSNAASNQPTVWTALSFETGENQNDSIAEILSQALKLQGWYINASTETDVFVIFPNKVFKYPKGDRNARERATNYALSIGIPLDQLDWSE